MSHGGDSASAFFSPIETGVRAFTRRLFVASGNAWWRRSCAPDSGPGPSHSCGCPPARQVSLVASPRNQLDPGASPSRLESRRPAGPMSRSRSREKVATRFTQSGATLPDLASDDGCPRLCPRLTRRGRRGTALGCRGAVTILASPPDVRFRAIKPRNDDVKVWTRVISVVALGRVANMLPRLGSIPVDSGRGKRTSGRPERDACQRLVARSPSPSSS